MPPPIRLPSVDALRGVTVAAMLLVNDPGDWGHVYAPLEHSAWHGCTPTDLVFPFFLFIVGVSIALGVAPRADAAGGVAARAALTRDVLLRALRIVLLGLALHAAAHWAMHTPAFRPFGVLQRIGLCFGAAGVLAVWTGARTQWAVFWTILLGYWALLVTTGGFERGVNLASRLDTALLGRFAYEFDAATGLGHEPEGVLSTLPAIATTLLGVRAGAWLRDAGRGTTRRMALAGLGALALGWVWSFAFPFNKNLWTSSFVLWAGGWALLALAAAHEAVDVRGWPALGRRFGANAIAAYAGAWLATCALEGSGAMAPLYAAGFGWIAPLAGPEAASLAFAMAFVGFWWAVVWVMDRRGWHPRI